MFKDDSYIRTIDEVLYVTYKEHPHVVSVHSELKSPQFVTIIMCCPHTWIFAHIYTCWSSFLKVHIVTSISWLNYLFGIILILLFYCSTFSLYMFFFTIYSPIHLFVISAFCCCASPFYSFFMSLSVQSSSLLCLFFKILMLALWFSFQISHCLLSEIQDLFWL